MDALDKAKLITGSDAKTGLILGMSKATVSQVRHGTRKLTPYQSAKLAELIGDPWHEAFFSRMVELGASEEERRFYRGKLSTLNEIVRRAVAVAFLTIGAVFLFPAGNAQASTLSPNNHGVGLFIARRSRPMNGSEQNKRFPSAGYGLRRLADSITRACRSLRGDMVGLPSFGPY